MSEFWREGGRGWGCSLWQAVVRIGPAAWSLPKSRANSGLTPDIQRGNSLFLDLDQARPSNYFFFLNPENGTKQSYSTCSSCQLRNKLLNRPPPRHQEPEGTSGCGSSRSRRILGLCNQKGTGSLSLRNTRYANVSRSGRCRVHPDPQCTIRIHGDSPGHLVSATFLPL